MPALDTRPRSPNIWWHLAAAFVGALLSTGSGPAASSTGVVIAEATTLGFPLTVEALGTARANESVEIRPQISERIVSISFAEGQRVVRGDTLVELDNTQALAEVAAARAALLDSEGKYQRARRLFETRAVSTSELEQREATRDADQANLTAAQSRLGNTTIRAPFGGRLGLRNVSIGTLVTPSTVITTLDDTETIKLDFDVPETAISRLAPDLPVVARSAAWRDVRFEGRVVAIDTRVDPISRSITVRALVPNVDERLRPGMFLTVELLRSDVQALMVPEQAIVPEQSRQFVFVVGPGEVVERRPVRLGRRRPGQVEVLEGLSEGERVVAEGTQQVREGDVVEIVGRVALGDPLAGTARP